MNPLKENLSLLQHTFPIEPSLNIYLGFNSLHRVKKQVNEVSKSYNANSIVFPLQDDSTALYFVIPSGC